MKPSKEEILACTDDKQLIELLAIAQGFTKVASGNDIKTELWLEVVLDDKGEEINRSTFRYNPLADTAEGKAQTVTLAHKYKLEVYFSDNYVMYKDYSEPTPESAYTWQHINWKDDEWQKAICKAAILCACEVE